MERPPIGTQPIRRPFWGHLEKSRLVTALTHRSDLEPSLLIVGAGQRTTDVLLPALARAGQPLKVAAICDPAPLASARIDRLRDEGALPADVAIFPGLSQALAARPYTVAIVACPHDEHQQATTRLLDAGVVVWKEKPFAMTYDQALDLASRPGPGLRVLAHRPHGYLYRFAADHLPTLGRLLSYRIRITRQTGDYSTTWRASKAQAGGGAILDLGYHAADLINRFATQPASVYAVTAQSPAHRSIVEVEETSHLVLSHEDGCTGTVYLSRCADNADELELVAEHGTISISGSAARIAYTQPGHLTSDAHITVTDDPWASMLRFHAQTLHDQAITADEIRIGLACTALVEAAYASLAQGQPVSVSAAPVLEGQPA